MPKKPKDPEFPQPLNMSENMNDMAMLDCGVMAFSKEHDEWGVLTVLTSKGHYDFIIDLESANALVQKLRDYIGGDSKPLVDD